MPIVGSWRQGKSGNWERAIKAYEEALKVFTEEEFPEIYQAYTILFPDADYYGIKRRLMG